MDTDNTSNDDSIYSFMNVTGADYNRAMQYMNFAEWNIENAITLFLENEGKPIGNTSDIIDVESEFSTEITNSDDVKTIPPVPQPSENVCPPPLVEDSVRAPDPFKRQRLVPEILSRTPYIPSPLSYTNDGRNTGVSHREAHNASIQDENNSMLFPPPHQLLFNGTFQQARSTARSTRRWLLVNIQDEKEFACHILNRDTWTDDLLQNIIASQYVFWQSNYNSDEGLKYCTLYNVESSTIPHIAIIDPRTSEKTLSWMGVVNAAELSEKLTDYCDRHSFDSFRPVSTITKEKSNHEIKNLTDDENVNNTTEDDELAAAIKASLEQNVSSNDSVSIHNTFCSSEELPNEPSVDDPNSTRVQIRTADGKRLVRRILKTDPVSLLFRFIRLQIPEARTKPFEVHHSFPAKLIKETNNSIESENLMNAAIVMQWA